MENKNIYETLQDVRVELSRLGLKKSGKNSHLGFNYYELGDFLNETTALFQKHGLFEKFDVDVEPNGIEYAYMTIIKGNESVVFKMPTAEPTGNNPIQMLGSKLTYCKRYLYLSVLNLSENDQVEPSLDSNKKVEFSTKLQQDKISANSKLVIEELQGLGIKNVGALKSLTKEKATELCKLIDERKS